MTDLIGDLRQQMQDRLKDIDEELQSVEGLIDEKARIEHALSLEPFAEPKRNASSNEISRRRPHAQGETKARFAAFVTERPGVTVAEAAAGIGITTAYARTLSSRLVKEGVIERAQLPSGRNGLRGKGEVRGKNGTTKEPKRARRNAEAEDAPRQDVRAAETEDSDSPAG